MPTDFFTGPQLLTLAGVAAATVIVVNTVRHAFQWSPRWFALVVALVLSLTAWVFWSPRSPEAFALAIVNAFVVYAAATGGNQIAFAAFGQPVSMRAYGERGFFDPWWGAR